MGRGRSSPSPSLSLSLVGPTKHACLVLIVRKGRPLPAGLGFVVLFSFNNNGRLVLLVARDVHRRGRGGSRARFQRRIQW